MKFNIDKLVEQALQEDQSRHDVTTKTLVNKNSVAEAFIVAKEDAVVCGLEFARKTLRKLDPKIKIKLYRADGDTVKKKDKILHIKGSTRTILSGERIALNFLSYLSGISTLTNTFVKKADSRKVKIMDTRKTTPGLRALEKMAVRTGGGVNHRFSLGETVFIKDNHRAANNKVLSIGEAIAYAKKNAPKEKIIVEVDTIAQFKEALQARPHIILLDNMNTAQMKKAVTLNKQSKNQCLLEASGGITLKNIHAVAKTGVDRISIGAITHSARAIDFSMELIP